MAKSADGRVLSLQWPIAARQRDYLLSSAQDILDSNWTGSSTIPSRTLYPHQWSWDAAFIAIGRSWTDQERAQAELEHLFTAQWTNGMVPHIVFNPEVPEDAYFPGPDFWQAERADGHPGGVRTSGITQPPLHARAVLEIYQQATDRTEALAFLRRMYPKLVAEHRYLATHRDPTGGGLASIIHPWESGSDNSPLWDHDLDELVIPPGALPPYTRRDLTNVDVADRPTDEAYDRFVYLAVTYRDSGYDDATILHDSPFLVEDPMFNAIWCWSALALGEIAALIGEDPAPHRQAASGIRKAMQTRLWDPRTSRYHAYDLRRDRLVAKDTVAVLVPILDPHLPADSVSAIVSQLSSPSFRPQTDGLSFVVPSYDLRSSDFDRRQYWRGPVWANTNWLLWRGLRAHGSPPPETDLIAASMAELVTIAGYREYFDPFTGAGYGSHGFSWTAALLIDLLHREPVTAAEAAAPVAG